MTKHTPGKWKVTTKQEYEEWWGKTTDFEENDIKICSFEDDEPPWSIADMIDGLEDGECRANAELIARAPELEAENARLHAENAELKDIEVANKETIRYWRSRVAELEEQIKDLKNYAGI